MVGTVHAPPFDTSFETVHVLKARPTSAAEHLAMASLYSDLCASVSISAEVRSLMDCSSRCRAHSTLCTHFCRGWHHWLHISEFNAQS